MPVLSLWIVFIKKNQKPPQKNNKMKQQLYNYNYCTKIKIDQTLQWANTVESTFQRVLHFSDSDSVFKTKF